MKIDYQNITLLFLSINIMNNMNKFDNIYDIGENDWDTDEMTETNMVHKISLGNHKRKMKREHNIDYISYDHDKSIKLIPLCRMIEKIQETIGQFVNPVIFVHFIKSSDNTPKHIIIEQNTLFKCKLWANQIRREIDHDLIQYIGYRIAIELLQK